MSERVGSATWSSPGRKESLQTVSWVRSKPKEEGDALVRAVRVEPVAAATSFAWNASMGRFWGKDGESGGWREARDKSDRQRHSDSHRSLSDKKPRSSPVHDGGPEGHV